MLNINESLSCASHKQIGYIDVSVNIIPILGEVGKDVNNSGRWVNLTATTEIGKIAKFMGSQNVLGRPRVQIRYNSLEVQYFV